MVFEAWSGFAVFWFCFMILLAIVWAKRHLDIRTALREPKLDSADAQGTDADLPALTVLVAAKDEETNIERCVRGLLAQQYPQLQIIAVDDRSRDRTGAIVDQLAAEDPRLLALHVRELPPGWFGKNNAMRLGVEHATGEFLCFTDADCTFDSDRLLASAVRLAVSQRIDLLSALPHLEANGFWERVIQPVAGGVMMYWTPPHRVNNPRSRAAYANGAFLLMPAAVYRRLGGHAAVAQTLNEDMHFARRAKALGLRLRVIQTAGMFRVRMYVGLAQIWRGWARIFYGCFGTFPKLFASVLMLALASVAPYVTVFAAPLVSERYWPLSAAAILTVIVQQSVLWRYYRLSGTPAPYAITYPLGAAMCLGITLDAMTRLAGRRTSWRGTAYTRGA